MSDSRDESPGEDYFNDLSQQPRRQTEDGGPDQEETGNGQVPKPKRIACVLCRKRKLKCDGGKPSCATCTRLQHECSYDEVRRKSGPKRGYVKALEARLAQVETLLKTQDDPVPQKSARRQVNGGAQDYGNVSHFGDISLGDGNINLGQHGECAADVIERPAQDPFPHTTLGGGGDGTNFVNEDPFPWEMIGLGLDEPLPTQDVVNELNQLYFEKMHPSVPMIHRSRYYAAMNLAPHMRPPVCLRYAMWCLAACVSEKYEQLQDHFYQRARKYIQQDEMRGHGESMITVAHCQTWVLLASYEFKLMYFPRAWMSAGRACRMTQMMGLHRLDGVGLDVKQCLPPVKDWTEREERRRTFWMAFCVDRYSSIGTGWPMTIEEKDIMSTLPVDEHSYELSISTTCISLEEALAPDGAASLNGFSGVIVMACLFGRNLTHLHRPSPDDADNDLNGEFWKRHRGMDNILLNTALTLPTLLRLPSGLNNPNIVFMNMCIHTSTICLHQAAIFKADKNQMPQRISSESKVRCITAAAEIASIMRQISHLDLSAMNPFISFCLYVSARVFVQYLKSRPKDTQIRSSLQFLLQAMQAIKRVNPLTESFLVQLDVDLEGANIEDVRSIRGQAFNKAPLAANRSEGCPMNQLHLNHKPNYGDNGLAQYNDPSTSIPITTASSGPQPAFGYAQANMMRESNIGGYMPGATQFEVPHRVRSAGSSNQSSGMHRSPQSFDPGMDMSTDGGSSGDHLTPNSSNQQNQSTRTSHTGHSPQNTSSTNGPQLSSESTPGRLTGPSLFDPNDTTFTADFDMNSFPASAAENQQSGYVLPSNWGAGSTGLTPGPTGMTPLGTGMTPGSSGIGDMMGMTDADWAQMMDSMNYQTDWENGAGQAEMLQDMMQKQQRGTQ